MTLRTRARFGNMPIVHDDRRDGLRYHIFYNERHGPHVSVHSSHWGGQTANIYIGTLTIQSGSLRPPELKRARKWIRRHRRELFAAWNDAKAGRHPRYIE